MKVIFLDIDGVLNNLEEVLHPVDSDIDYSLPQPKHLDVLKHIIDQTGAEIVLSSGWRLSLDGIQHVIDALYPLGLTLRGVTPENVELSTLRMHGFDIQPCLYDKCRHEGNIETIVQDRGAQIAVWLMAHPEYTEFLILDDEVKDIKQYFPNNYIETDISKGLLPEHITSAIQILSGEKHEI